MLYNGITHRADSGVAPAALIQLQCAMHRITTRRPLQTKQTVCRRETIKSSPLLFIYLRVLHLFTRLDRMCVGDLINVFGIVLFRVVIKIMCYWLIVVCARYE